MRNPSSLTGKKTYRTGPKISQYYPNSYEIYPKNIRHRYENVIIKCFIRENVRESLNLGIFVECIGTCRATGLSCDAAGHPPAMMLLVTIITNYIPPPHHPHKKKPNHQP